MKYFTLIVAQIIVLFVVVFFLMNYENVTTINLMNGYFSSLTGIAEKSITLSTGALTLLFFVLGEGSAVLFFLPFLAKNKEKQGAFERRLEKSSVSTEESSSKVKVLEAKIQVLEKALSDALKK